MLIHCAIESFLVIGSICDQFPHQFPIGGGSLADGGRGGGATASASNNSRTKAKKFPENKGANFYWSNTWSDSVIYELYLMSAYGR